MRREASTARIDSPPSSWPNPDSGDVVRMVNNGRDARRRMAQWRGQFTWLTHQTKLEDAEAVLRRAVVAFRGAPPADVAAKAKAVRQVAERVLNLRLKLLKARRAAQPPSTTAARTPSN
jgi:hypothetical protein